VEVACLENSVTACSVRSVPCPMLQKGRSVPYEAENAVLHPSTRAACRPGLRAARVVLRELDLGKAPRAVAMVCSPQ
jgi:hypothetical protein